MAESFYGGRAGHDFTIYHCYSPKKDESGKITMTAKDVMIADFKELNSHTPIGGYCLTSDGELYRREINNNALSLGNIAVMGMEDLENTFLYRDGANIKLPEITKTDVPTKILTMENNGNTEKFAYCGITGGTGISVSMEEKKIKINNTFSLKAATSSELGGIKTGYTSSGKNYAIKLDSSNNAYVNVPWENTTYSVKNAVSGGTEVSLVTTGEKALWNGKQDDLLFDTGTTNGTFKYRPYNRPNWSSVEIKGLGSAAYTNTDAYLASNITTLNLDTLLGRQIGSLSSILQGAIDNSTVAIPVGTEVYLFGTNESVITEKTLQKDHSLVFHGALPWMWRPVGNWKVEAMNSMITAYIVGTKLDNTQTDIIPIHPNDIDASGSYTITYTPSTDLKLHSIKVRSAQNKDTQPTGTIPPGASWNKEIFSNTNTFQSYYVCDNSAVKTYIKSVQKLFKKLLEKAEFTEDEIKRI